MARVTQLLFTAEDRPGELARVCSELARVAVNISAIMTHGAGDGTIRLVATPLPTARKVLDGLGLRYREEEAIAVRLTDRPGALGRVTRKLADAGINVEYAYGSITRGAERALIIVGVSDVDKAEKLV